MLLVQLTYALLFLSLCASAMAFPSTPLNQRRQEISWQAWLLVDDQNQNRQPLGDSTLPRRRITPKSVFVAPTFSPENLPPCAEGYSSDSMGRCIKIIKLDEDRHLEFLVSKLNDKFGVIDYEEEEEEEVMGPEKSEPFQLNIPLNLDGDDYSNDTPQEELDFAIIVTPTTRHSDKSSSKVDKRNGDELYEEELKKLLKTTTTTTDKYEETTQNAMFERSTNLDDAEDRTEISTWTTTVNDVETTTMVPTTVTNEETTTLQEDLEAELKSATEFSAFTTTTTTEATTTLEGTTEETTSTVNPTVPKLTTTIPKITTYHPYVDLSILAKSRIKNLVKFPDDEQLAIPRSHPDGTYVRFPDVDSKYQQESLIHHTRDVAGQSRHFFDDIATSETSQKVHEALPPPKAWEPRFRVNRHHYEYRVGATTSSTQKPASKKRGNMFLLPPKWSGRGDHQKPLVLRLSRKHFDATSSKFKNDEFYRSLPMDDLSFLFGYKQTNGLSNNR